MREKIKIRNSCKRFNVVCALIMLIVLIFNILKPDFEYSELENRYLQQLPKLTLSGLANGSFAEDVENYLNDQFIGRNFFVKLKAAAEYITGKRENNGVYVCSDGYLIEKPARYDETLINNNITAIKKLENIGRYDVTVAVIPSAFEVLNQYLPNNVYNNTVSKLNAHIADSFSGTDIKNVDTTDELKKYNDNYLYYKTDHHTTSHGAFIIYNKLAEALGYEPLKGEDFTISSVSREFLGTTYSKALRKVSPDVITEYRPIETARFKVKFPYDNRQADSMYFPEHLDKKDKYSYFLDGNHALTVIEGPNKNGKKLVVFRDSYANCMIPMVANHFEEIHLIDLRYYNDDVIGYITENEIEEVLFLYSSQTFMTDASISKITSYVKSSPYSIQPYGKVYKTKAVDDSYFEETAFVGDSLTDGFRMHSGLYDSTFICGTSMTINGLSTREWKDGYSMLDRIKQGGFEKIYIMLGINENIVMSYKDTFIEKYKGLIDIVRESNPDALIYVQSILPVTASLDSKGRITNTTINAYNESLLEMCNEKQVYYLDINSALTDSEGFLPEEAAVDGVHFKKEYYLKWLEYLKYHAVRTENNENADETAKVVLENGRYDVAAVSDAILGNVQFKDELAPIDARVLLGIYDIDGTIIQNASGFAGGGATAEEIAVFEVKNIADVPIVEQQISAHIESKKKSFESYIPEEIPKLNRPYIHTNENLVVVCIADDYGNLDEIIRAFEN